MSGKRILLAAMLITPSLSLAGEIDLHGTFAGCAGRYSAEMEHAWLMGDPDAEYYESRRAQFVELLDSVTPTDYGAETLSLRIDAKFAHASLLHLATFSENPDQAERAIGRARTEIDYCTSFLLES